MNDTIDTSTCNTKERSRAWMLTINNHTEDDLMALDKEKVLLDDWAWQEEKGKEGTTHLQIAIKYPNAISFSSVKNKFPRAHIEKSKNWVASKKYCTKDDTATGMIKDRKNRLMIKDPLEGKELYDWQKEVIQIINEEPDDRKIHWYFDEVGCKGKTTLAKHLCIKDDNCIYMNGKCADMKYGLYKRIEQGKKIRCILIDFVRSVETFVSYDGIESVKNGIFYNSKFESTMVLFDCPHVIIFANFLPEMNKLSLDRWILHVL